MRKKFLATLMAVSMMVIGMVGCGEESDNKGSTASTATRPTEATQPIVTAVPQTQVTARPTMVPETTPSPTTALVVTPQPIATTAPTEEPEEEISGLIVMTASRNALAKTGKCIVSSFDPESGEMKEINTFKLQDGSDYSYTWLESAYRGLCQFDDTYSKMSTLKFFGGTADMHAGWLLPDGTFFDVTKALGWERKSDFAEVVRNTPHGFTSNGLFVFSVDNPKNIAESTWYSVPINDVKESNVQEYKDIIYRDQPVMDYTEFRQLISHYGSFSSWLNDSCCLLTTNRSYPSSIIFNIKDKTSVEYIPGDSRNNWNGQSSPDGTQIAFVSEPRNGAEQPDIFIVPAAGGEPVRVASHDFVMSKNNSAFASGSLSYSNCALLIDWR